MATFHVTVTGHAEVIQAVGRLAAGAGFVAGTRVLVGSNLNYARAVHEGSPAHEIRPRNKKALYWRGAAHPVRVVHHPGTKGNPFLAKALDAERANVEARIAAGLQRIAEGAPASGIVQDLHAAGLVVQAAAQRTAPVRTGTLRRSLHTEVMSR